jgi:hypothetical protein
MRLFFTTVTDVATQLAGHADRFTNDADWARACVAVWEAAEHSPRGASISKRDADDIMDEEVRCPGSQ